MHEEKTLEEKLRYEAKQTDGLLGTNVAQVNWTQVAKIATDHFKCKD